MRKKVVVFVQELLSSSVRPESSRLLSKNTIKRISSTHGLKDDQFAWDYAQILLQLTPKLLPLDTSIPTQLRNFILNQTLIRLENWQFILVLILRKISLPHWRRLLLTSSSCNCHSSKIAFVAVRHGECSSGWKTIYSNSYP